MRDTSRKWGLPLTALQGDPLYLVPEQFDEDPKLTISLWEKFAPYQREIEEDWGISCPWGEDPEVILNKSRWLQPQPYFSEFSFDELAKYIFNHGVWTEVHKQFERHHEPERIPPEPFEFIYKLRNSLHYYAPMQARWNNLVTAYYAIPEFSFGPEFEVRFEHSSYFNEWGTGQHSVDDILTISKKLPYKESSQYFSDNVIYLDGVFAYLVHYRGKHVLTVGFSLGEGRIYINQVQLRQPKGNRWLYNLPTDVLSYSVDQMYRHFTGWGFDIYLVEGASIAQRIVEVHKKDPPPTEVIQRIANFYNQPLVGYCRGNLHRRSHFNFYRIFPC